MAGDPLIDEVRAIRQEVVREAGNDLALLCDRLREIERQFHSRTGPFTDVPVQPVPELFPLMNKPTEDPLLDDLHRMRQRNAET
ncbi:MAG: hypothetical protein IT440_00760 [Phycisphaeraceae bacterium]|nr:hypothetical protein [Phycisphaeraceae bacterium]